MTDETRPGPGRPKLYAYRLGSLKLTAAQREDLEASAKANQRSVSSEIRARIDRYRAEATREEAMPA